MFVTLYYTIAVSLPSLNTVSEHSVCDISQVLK